LNFEFNEGITYWEILALALHASKGFLRIRVETRDYY